MKIKLTAANEADGEQPLLSDFTTSKSFYSLCRLSDEQIKNRRRTLSKAQQQQLQSELEDIKASILAQTTDTFIARQRMWVLEGLLSYALPVQALENLLEI